MRARRNARPPATHSLIQKSLKTFGLCARRTHVFNFRRDATLHQRCRCDQTAVCDVCAMLF
jgi:hypothetical protein